MGRTCLWAVIVCLIVFSPFAGMAGAREPGDRAAPVASKDWSESGVGGEIFREAVFTINGKPVAERRQGERSDTPGLTPEAPTRQTQEVYGKLPLYFIQNDGQMDERVKFYEKGNGHAIFFTDDGVYLSLQKVQDPNSETINSNFEIRNPNYAIRNPKSAIVRLIPLGANKHPKIVAEGLQQGKVNYFIGNQPEGWRTNIPTYGAVVYKDIYDGIDIKFYGNNRQLEYDVIVRHSADPSQVRFAYEGIEDLRVNENGDLEIIVSKSGEACPEPVEWAGSAQQTGSNQSNDCPPLAGVKGVDGAVLLQPEPSYLLNTGVYGAGGILYTASLIRLVSEYLDRGYEYVIPAEAGIQKNTGFRVKPGMTDSCKLMSLCIEGINGGVQVANPKSGFGQALNPQRACPGEGGDLSPQYEKQPPESPFFKGDLGKEFVKGDLGKDCTASYTRQSQGMSDPYYAEEKIIQRRPYVYQEIDGKKVEIEGEFRVLSSGYGVKKLAAQNPKPEPQNPKLAMVSPQSTVLNLQSETHNPQFFYGFCVAPYDTSRPLIIDPVFEYSTYIGGDSTDKGYAIAVDNSGSAYVTGFTTSSNFPRVGTTTGYATNTDVFVTKLGTETPLALIYSTYIGGSNIDYGIGITVDGSGSAYVTGYTYSSNFPLTGTSTAKKSGADAFVTKLGASGDNLEYSTYIGGSGDDLGQGIAVDNFGSAYITGYTSSSNFPVVGTSTAKKSGDDVFVTRLGTETPLALIYSTYIGGSGSELGRGIAVDGSGSAYISGYTTSTNFPVVGTTTGHAGGTYDSFVTKLGTETPLALIYSTYIGGSGDDVVIGIAVDDSGSAYVSGHTTSTNFPVVGTTTGHAGGTYDAFVTRLGTETPLALIYSTYIGGSGNDYCGQEIDVDGSGSAYISGYTTSTDFPVVGTTTGHAAGTEDAFVTKLGTGAPIAITYSTYIGGSGSDVAFGIAVDGSGSAYVTGYTTSSNFPVAGTSTAKKSGDDVFVTKLIFTPWVATGSAADIAVNSATLTGTVSAIGMPATAMFSYGVISGSYTGTSSTQSVTGENTAVSISVSGLSEGTTYYYRLVANNSAGTSTGSEQSFTTSSPGGGDGEPEKEKLTISSTSPSSGATGVSVTTTVSATFNMYVNGATVTTDSFTLSDENGDVSGSVVTNGVKITFTPSLALSYGTKYTATVTTRVQAANWAGTTMESDYTWNFTTESEYAVTPTPATSPSPTPAVTVTPAATPEADVTPTPTAAPSPTATVTYTPAPALPPKPTPPPAECTADSVSLSSYNLRLKMEKSKDVIVRKG